MPIWLTKIGNAFKVVFTWLKGNFVLVLAVLAGVYGFLTLRRRDSAYSELMEEFRKQQAQNRQQLEELRRVQQDQILKQQEIDRKYREVVASIEQSYRDQLQNLSRAKEQELRQIISRTHENPIAMAEEINSLFGLPVYTPPSN
jgi:DNA anti-recombination protein RmuC